MKGGGKVKVNVRYYISKNIFFQILHESIKFYEKLDRKIKLLAEKENRACTDCFCRHTAVCTPLLLVHGCPLLLCSTRLTEGCPMHCQICCKVRWC